MDTLGTYEVRKLPWNSFTAADIIDAGRRRHHVAAFVEIDVTTARERMRAHAQRTGTKLSFTGWLACCLARGLADHPTINAHRHGRFRKVTFQDVDVLVIVERETGGEKRPLPFVLRKVQHKSVLDVTAELRAAQTQRVADNEFVVDQGGWGHWLGRIPFLMTLYALLPSWVRGLFWRWLAGNAFATKRIMGTAGITSIGMFGRVAGWPLTTGNHTIDLVVGSIARKPAVLGDEVRIREMLALTVLVDHDLVDGGPAARCVAHFAELLEQAYGLGSV